MHSNVGQLLAQLLAAIAHYRSITRIASQSSKLEHKEAQPFIFKKNMKHLTFSKNS